MLPFDRLWINARLVTMQDDSIVEGGAVACRDGRIVAVGRTAELAGAASRETIDLGGALVTPGLVDCHTHLVFAGDRSHEFEQRLQGRSYAEIARAGGGIRSTVRATRAATEDDLLRSAAARLDRLVAEGVTTLEVKSGYGLDLATELRMLRVGRRLGGLGRARVTTTLLGLHALPPEFADDRAGYVQLCAGPLLDAAVTEGLADAVDAFCEGIAFTPDETATVLRAARDRGLKLRLHADQLSDTGGAALAADLGALSADHVEYTGEQGARAMGAAGTVAVILPGAFYMLQEQRKPPVAAFRAQGVRMAVATDANPGSSPLLSPLLAMNMACVLFGLTPMEALRGTTLHGAAALGLDAEIGSLEVGKRCDLAVWRVGRVAELVAWMGAAPLIRRVLGGADA